MGYIAILVSKDFKGGDKFKVTSEMIETAPSFDTKEEANNYCDLISTDYLWIITEDDKLSDEK